MTHFFVLLSMFPYLSSAQNAPPIISGFDTSVTYTENDPPVILDADVVVTDTDSPDFGGGELHVQVLQVTGIEQLSVRNQGTGPGQIGSSVNSVSYGGIPIGTISGFSYSLVITLNTNASVQAVQALLRNVTFTAVSENPHFTRNVAVQVTDGDGGYNGGYSNKQSKVISLIPINDPPTITGFEGAVNYFAGGAPALMDTNAVLEDVDTFRFTSGRLTLRTVTNVQQGDLLSIQNEGSGYQKVEIVGPNVFFDGKMIATKHGGNGQTPLVVIFNSISSRIAVQAVIRHTMWRSTSTSTAPRRVQLSFDDGLGGSSGIHSKQVIISR